MYQSKIHEIDIFLNKWHGRCHQNDFTRFI